MDQFNTPWRVTAAAIYTTPTDSRVYGRLDIDVTEVRRGEIAIRTGLPLTGTFDHRIVDGMQIGKFARAIKRNFRKPERLDEVPGKELESCLFKPREE
jgi:pyruvate/2-oxoglutarate dehydrogenase complex dihydrolipoamide acyltransferase (E2) component